MSNEKAKDERSKAMKCNEMTYISSSFFLALECVQDVSADSSRSATHVHCLLEYYDWPKAILVFASSVNQGNHFTAQVITAVTTLKHKTPASASRTHPIPSACRFRRSSPASSGPGSNASSICVFFERFGMYLKSNVVSSPRPLLFLIMICQNTLRSA